MSNEELVKLIQEGINPADNLGQLFLQNRGIIDKILRKYGFIYRVKNSKTSVAVIEYQDLMDEAYFGLAEAVQKYEYTAGVKFISYAPYWIEQSIHRFIDGNGSAVRIPFHLQEKVNQYRKAMNAFNSQLHREPTDKELCRYLQCKLPYLGKIRKVIHRYNQIDSLDRDLPDDEGLTLGGSIKGDTDIENEVIDKMMEKSRKSELWQIVKENTSEQENNVIRCRFIRNMSLESIGHECNLTRERIRQIEAKGLRKLRYPRVTRLLADRFEMNYARAYYGSLTNFKYTGTSIVEDITIKNLEDEALITDRVNKPALRFNN